MLLQVLDILPGVHEQLWVCHFKPVCWQKYLAQPLSLPWLLLLPVFGPQAANNPKTAGSAAAV